MPERPARRRAGELSFGALAGLALLGLAAAAAVALAASGTLAPRLAGLARLGEPDVAALDRPADTDDREAPRFLAERDRVVVEVPREMTAGELLRLVQLDFPHVRRQIARQLGVDTLPLDRRLSAGARFEVTLTPPEAETP
jgi:hypothetical protein